jgi:hypothetical protein
MADAKSPDYPFVPRSNAHLLPGQFFSFRLSSGRFACGRVLEARWPHQPGSRTLFRVGLMDWSGDAPADAGDLAGRGVLEQGYAHVRIVARYGATIDGCRPLEADGIVPDLSQGEVYGLEVLRILAHKHLGSAPPTAVGQIRGGRGAGPADPPAAADRGGM